MLYTYKNISCHSYACAAVLFILLISALIVFTEDVSAASDKMRTYISPSGVFQVKIPGDFDIQRNTLRTTNETVLNGERISSVIDQRPYKNQVKNYVVQLEQTFGSALDKKEKEYLVEYTMQKYIDFYRRNNNAIVKSQEKAYYGDFLGGELYLTYTDSKKQEQAIRIKVLYTDISKIQLIATSSDQAVYSLKNQEFFSSIRAVRGTTSSEGSFLQEWEEHVSPMHLFSVLLPPKADPYTPGEPIIETTDNAELFHIPMYDPVRGDKFDYRIYGYRLKDPLTYTNARRFLIDKHIGKYIKYNSDVKFATASHDNKYPVIETNFLLPMYRDKNSRLRPRPNSEKAVTLRASFLGNYIVVQEISSTRLLLQSHFATNLLSKLLFHPDEAENLRLKKDAPIKKDALKEDLSNLLDEKRSEE